MMHTIETSTSALNHIIYHGLYETWIGEYYGAVPYENRAEVDDEIGKLALEYITNMFNEILPDDFGTDQDFNLEYMHTTHPREYNFYTDNIVFKFEYTDELKNYFESYARANKDDFKEYLKNHYTSRSGFISLTPNNWDEWLKDWDENEWRSVSAFLCFYISTAASESEIEDWTQEFEEDVRILIEENYTPWEYAVKYENGFVVCVWPDYDNEEDCNLYRAYLIDDNNKIINQTELLDCNFEFQGAFDAWNNMDYDLVKDFIPWGMKYKPCDMPNNKVLGIFEA